MVTKPCTIKESSGTKKVTKPGERFKQNGKKKFVKKVHIKV